MEAEEEMSQHKHKVGVEKSSVYPPPNNFLCVEW